MPDTAAYPSLPNVESPWIGLVQPQNIIVIGSNVKGYVYNAVYQRNFRTVSKS